MASPGSEQDGAPASDHATPSVAHSGERAALASACRILSLDGGGAKGFYSLGVLKELEAMVGRPLYQCFDLIFGTSTGGIIAALLALGHSVDNIHALYKEHVPAIMRRRTARGKSEALAHLARTVFADRSFADVKTFVQARASCTVHQYRTSRASQAQAA